MAPQMSSKAYSQLKDNLPPLHQAVMKSDRLHISRLLAENTDIEARNDQGGTELHLAVLLGLEDLVQLLLNAYANTGVKDYEDEDMTQLYYASGYLYQGIFKLLVSGIIYDASSETMQEIDYVDGSKHINAFEKSICILSVAV